MKSLISLRTIAASARPICPAVSVLRASRGCPRQIHASSSVSRKKQSSSSIIEEEAIEEDETEEDLFAEPTSSSSSSEESRQQTRSALITQIHSTTPKEATHLRVGVLRRIVSLTSTEEELDEIKKIFRAWRILGKKVTKQTTTEVIGRCCKLGKAELAVELLNNPLEYGLYPPTNSTLTRLHHALLTQSPSPTSLPILGQRSISPTLAALRIALLSEAAEAPNREVSDLVGRAQGKTVSKIGSQHDEWRALALSKLREKGGAWADAVEKISAAAS